MKLKGTLLPGYPAYEYFLILSLPAPIQNEVLELRTAFHNNFETKHQIKGLPSLALLLFLQYETMEENISEIFERVASFFGPMEIQLENFGSFPTHSIFVRVVENSPVYDLAKEIHLQTKGMLQVNKETKPLLMLHPHIGIARRLEAGIYKQAWEKYNVHTYRNKFTAGGMILLRRPDHNHKWELVRSFEFKNKTPPSTQGTLF